MKHIYASVLLCAILSLGLLTGCDQGVARSLDGELHRPDGPQTWIENSTAYLGC